MKLCELTIHGVHDWLNAGRVSSVELTQAVMDRILAVDNKVKAYLTLMPEFALEQAREADERRARGENGSLLGVPLAIKDVICVEGSPTTCGSRILENFSPPYSATVIERLRDQGAVLLGKTNTDSLWDRPPRIPPSALRETRGIRIAFQAGRAAVRVQPLPWTWRISPWVRTPAAACVSRPRSVA